MSRIIWHFYKYPCKETPKYAILAHPQKWFYLQLPVSGSMAETNKGFSFLCTDFTMVALNRGKRPLFFFSLIYFFSLILFNSSEKAWNWKNQKPLHGHGIIKSICSSLLGCILQWKCPKNQPMFIYYLHSYPKFVLLGYANWNIIEKYKFPMRRD